MAQARVKLSQQTISEIQRRLANGERPSHIASALGVKPSTVTKYNKAKIDKLENAAAGIVVAAETLASLPPSDQTRVISRAEGMLATRDANKITKNCLANIAALSAMAGAGRMAAMTDAERSNPESLAPVMCTVRLATEALNGVDKLADIIDESPSDLKSISASEFEQIARKVAADV